MTAPVPMDRMEAAGTDEDGRPRGRSASFASLVCAPHVPAHPGRSSREERAYQFLRHLMGLSTVQLFSHRPAIQQPAGHRAAPADVLYTPITLSLFRPDLVSLLDTRPRLRTRLATGLRRQRLPILGPSCPVQVTEEFLHVRAFARPALQDALDRQEPDFLFVMPQTNPVALTLSTRHCAPGWCWWQTGSRRTPCAGWPIHAAAWSRWLTPWRPAGRTVSSTAISRASMASSFPASRSGSGWRRSTATRPSACWWCLRAWMRPGGPAHRAADPSR